MKRLLFAVLVIGMMVGCVRSNVTKKQKKRRIDHGLIVEVVEIEGCEYFKCETHMRYYTLCHKGNCTNPIHSEHLTK